MVAALSTNGLATSLKRLRPFGFRLWMATPYVVEGDSNFMKCQGTFFLSVKRPLPSRGGGNFFIDLFYVSDDFKQKNFWNFFFKKFFKFFGRQTLFLCYKKTRENSNAEKTAIAKAKLFLAILIFSWKYSLVPETWKPINTTKYHHSTAFALIDKNTSDFLKKDQVPPNIEKLIHALWF